MEESTSRAEESHDASNVINNSDINVAAALRAQYAIVTPQISRRRHKKPTREEVEEPLIDNTKVLPLHSKKTERLQKRQHRKIQKAANAPADLTLTDLPSETLTEVFRWLRVADVFRMSRTCHTMMDLMLHHEKVISKDIISRRYWTLYRCFPLPVSFQNVPEEFHSGLLSEKRQELLNIHRKSYHQHIQMIDPREVCTCMTCVFAWNNLCLLIDLHHWQHNLANREPIPMIPRGTHPEWNQELLMKNAEIVRLAMRRPLYYAAILEQHLSTITGTILRFSKWKKKGAKAQPRLYNMTDQDVDAGTDEFLESKGPPSYDFPYHRDNYYSLEAYLPNRKFGADGRWHYYALPPTQHERDLEWVRSTLVSAVPPEQRRAQAMANLKDHNVRWSQYLERAQQTQA
ncbi:hypothetical protein PMZ80_000435 [Knufia obscura]|uniref:F-box domain-containing protein n=2 Tax=Knufia TaxID=430999 RepID=A0AAN8EQZ0_9EURO|nr:hypothetical protein PMZ80_000435 [Knufia obscura]KAK5956637.1 hypothetical protein OHC33_002123 [Knufia fluminis]